MNPPHMHGPNSNISNTYSGGTSVSAIHASQNDLYQLLMQAPVAIVIFNGPEYVIELANDLYLPIAGKSRDAILDKPVAAAIPIAVSQGFIEILDGIRTTGEPMQLTEHKTLIERNGQIDTTYLNIVYKPVREAGGTVQRIMVLVTDVTEQVLARKKVEESEKRFRALVENSTDVIALSDMHGVFSYVSPPVKNVFGYGEEELIGKNVLEFVHPDDVPALREKSKSLVEAKTVLVHVVRFRHKEGHWRWIEATVSNLCDVPYVNAFVCNLHDITQEKKAREAIVQSERRYRSIFDAVPAAIFEEDYSGIITELSQLNLQHGPHLKRYLLQHRSLVDHFLKTIRIRDVNRKALQLFEAADKNELLRGLPQVFTEETIPVFIDKLVAIVTDQKGFEREFALQSLHGKPLYCLVSFTLMNADYSSVLVSRVDISDRKQAEQVLRATKEQLELTFRNVPSAIYHFDGNGNILYLNEKAAHLMGYPSVQEALGQKDVSQVRSKLGDVFLVLDESGTPMRTEQTATAIAFRTKQPVEVVTQVIHKQTGDTSWLLSKSAPVCNDAGELYMVLTTATDITHQKTAEEKVRQSEEQLLAFGNNIQNLAWIADGEGWVNWYNQRWYDYTGTTLQEMQGWGWEKVQHPDYADRIMAFVKKAWKRDESFELTFPLRRYDGEYRWFLTRAVPVKNSEGKIYRWIGTSTDIHEQKLAEERFRTLAETLPQLVWMTDANGTYEYASSQWQHYTGSNPLADDSWASVVHPDDFGSLMQNWSQCLVTGHTYTAEVRLRSKTGDYRWHAVQGDPLRNEEGKIIKWIGAFTDIHEQRTMTEKLEGLVAQRTQELQRSNDDLQQFAHVASHDLKEPVRKIRTFGNRLSTEYSNLLPERARLYLDKMEAAASRMYKMIDGVLDYSSVSTTTEQLVEAINLTEIIQHVESDLEVVIQQKGAVLEYQQLPVMEGSAVLIHQLFYNLINNALKFSRADVPPVIQLSASIIRGAAAAQSWGLSRMMDYVQVLVQDNGIGFSQEHAERIFKTFTRLNAKDKYEGTGLGLALCKKIVERHHGLISAVGMEGKGSIFKVLLPLKQLKS